MNRTRAAVVAVITGTALAVSACGSSGSSSPSSTTTSASSGSSSSGAPSSSSGGGGGSVVIGSANFGESVLLMNIYAGALKAKGVEVSTKPKIGSREVYLTALKDGSIDLIPEYSGTLLQFLDPKATAVSTDDVYKALPAAVGTDLKVLEQSQAQDKDSITVTKATADKYSLKSIADLSAHAGDLILGGAPEFKTRPDGVPGLKSKYNVVFGQFKTLDAGGPLTINALKNGQVDAADVFTTDSNIPDNGWVVLEDPKNLFAAQNILPLISAKKSNATVDGALNAVSAKLTTDGLTELDKKVNGGTDPAQVADEWLKAQGLV